MSHFGYIELTPKGILAAAVGAFVGLVAGMAALWAMNRCLGLSP